MDKKDLDKLSTDQKCIALLHERVESLTRIQDKMLETFVKMNNRIIKLEQQ